MSNAIGFAIEIDLNAKDAKDAFSPDKSLLRLLRYFLF